MSIYRRLCHIAIKLNHYVFYIFVFPFYWLGYLLPRNRKLWVFGYHHAKFVDNASYVMEYVRQNHPEIRTVWLARNRSEKKYVRRLGYESFLQWELKGLLVGFRAAAGFVTTGYIDLNPITLGGMKIIQLWHGTPLKRMVLDTNAHAWWLNKWYATIIDLIRHNIMPYSAHRYAMLTVDAPVARTRLKTAFALPQERIQLTGTARGDIILGGKVGATLEKLPIKNHRVLLYAPTFRDRGDPLDGGKIDVGDFDRVLEENNAILLVKLHPSADIDRNFILEIRNSSKIIILESKDAPDITRILPSIDILITDYSSVMFDFSLLERPILLFSPDIENYKLNRGFYEDYEILSEGRYAVTWMQLLQELKECLLTDEEWYKQRTKNIKKKYNIYSDRGNRKRIVSAVREILNA